ncbi:MAG TPA: hypothetical protein VF230_05750 [Acidimicrobiales bacterium]
MQCLRVGRRKRDPTCRVAYGAEPSPGRERDQTRLAPGRGIGRRGNRRRLRERDIAGDERAVDIGRPRTGGSRRQLGARVVPGRPRDRGEPIGGVREPSGAVRARINRSGGDPRTQRGERLLGPGDLLHEPRRLDRRERVAREADDGIANRSERSHHDLHRRLHRTSAPRLVTFERRS